MPSSAATEGCTGPMTEPDGTSGGSFVASTPARLHQLRVVVQDVEPAVVGEPGRRHRHVRRGSDAGEPHREVVDRLEVPPGPCGRPRAASCSQVQHVPDRVGAGRRRHAAGAAHPGGQRARVVALDRSADDRAASTARPGCPSTSGTSPTGTPVGVDRHRARPLAGDARRRRPRSPCDPGLGQPAPGARRRRAATTPRRPGWPRRRSPQRRGDGVVLPPDDLAAGGDQPDLRAAGAQVDGEDEPVVRAVIGPAAAGDCWVSSMSVITATMNSSTSVVSPPATPP